MPRKRKRYRAGFLAGPDSRERTSLVFLQPYLVPSSRGPSPRSFHCTVKGAHSRAREEFVASRSKETVFSFSGADNAARGLELRAAPASRAFAFSRETAYYNPLCPLRLLPWRFLPFDPRREDRSSPQRLARPRSKKQSNGGEEKAKRMRSMRHVTYVSCFKRCSLGCARNSRYIRLLFSLRTASPLSPSSTHL